MNQLDDREPEKLNLTKKQVLDIIDSLVLDFGGNKKDNWEYILEAKCIKALIKYRVPDAKFGQFWSKFIKRVDAVRYENAVEVLPEPIKEVYQQVKAQKYIDFSRLVK